MGWENSPDNAWENQTPADETYISVYHNFLQTDYACINVTDCTSDLERAELYARTQEDDEDNYEYQTSTHQEEWMLLCQLSPTFQQEDPPQSNINWEESANEIPQPLFLSCPSWINTMKNVHNATRQLPEVDITNLYGEQCKAYSIVSAHCAENATFHTNHP